MPAGMEAYDQFGRLIFDTSTKMSRLLAVVGVGTSDGSYAVPGAPYNYYVAWPTRYTGGVPPRVYMSGATVIWTFGSTPVGLRSGCTVLVMGY